MALKKLIPHRPTRLAVKFVIAGLVLLLLDFCIWYIADRYRFRYESVVFTTVFTGLMLVSCWKVEKSQVLATMSPMAIIGSLFFGTTMTVLVVSAIFVLPVVFFPNYLGLAGMFGLMLWLGRKTAKRQPA